MEIIGCGGICYQSELPSPENLSGINGYLMNIYTLPEMRGRGVGKRIVEFLIDDAKEKDCVKIFLETSVMARGLYRECGFTEMTDYMMLERQDSWGARG